MFNTILAEADLSLADVRLLRHKDQRAVKGRTVYELWRDARPQFDLYQSTQKTQDRTKLRASYWASFVGTPLKETMFAGLYNVKYRGLLEAGHAGTSYGRRMEGRKQRCVRFNIGAASW